MAKRKKQLSVDDLLTRWIASDPDENPAWSRKDITREVFARPPIDIAIFGALLQIDGGRDAIAELEKYADEITEEATAKQE